MQNLFYFVEIQHSGLFDISSYDSEYKVAIRYLKNLPSKNFIQINSTLNFRLSYWIRNFLINFKFRFVISDGKNLREL